MDVTAVAKTPDTTWPGSGSVGQSGTNQADGSANSQGNSTVTNASSSDAAKTKSAATLSPDKLGTIVDALNQFLETQDNTGIKFKLYDKDNIDQLMVQVVDQKTGKVLKEMPPHEMLDTIAAIREYVGAIVDKKV